ncbi:PREDICTED: glucose-6-phosphatase-like [Priapulus caudatus]|uniref:glucose-6-phosphatase n=1 Tax=Priapulus caudatus TaxID=37621 RepID=A0ABM1DYP5_PRICU|nr:PREDICTED: glucose-6-phosphatase-like [Priapulus caudatus]
MTCETGPGSPSGHAMITGAVWCVLIAALLRKLQKHVLPGHEGVSRVVSAVVWAIFAVCYLLVCLSRLSLGAHFPHQIIAGAICGMVLVAGLAWIPITSMRTRNYVITSGVLFGLAYDEYLCIRCLGFNPDWSVVKALTFCKEQGWVNLNTAPLHSLARLCGALLGLGIGLNLRTWVSPIPEGYGQGQKRYRRPWDARMVTAVLAAGLYRYAESLPLPYEPMALFYVSAFVKHTIVPVLVVAVVPLVGDFIIRCFHHFPLHKRL